MIITTKYYDEFLRYFKMAKWQQDSCNLGSIPYIKTPFDDDLIKHVHIYDVVERKYAGFTQLLLDIVYGYSLSHPYYHKMDNKRKKLCKSYIHTSHWKLREWLFVFMVHRLTGSGIHYGKENSGYYNSPLLHFTQCKNIKDMIKAFKGIKGPKYTSKGYQIAAFPKPQKPYDKGGDYYICEFVPDLIDQFIKFLDKQKSKPSFRKCLSFLQKYNDSIGCRKFNFQFSAFLADLADFFPEKIDVTSPFMYGKNALECLELLAYTEEPMPKQKFYDAVAERICKDTGMLPYNAEDVMCDSIRWIENYIDSSSHYKHLDLDKIFSSHSLVTHPRGRQKPMLALGLIDTFNGKPHPHDYKVINSVGLTPRAYRTEVKKWQKRRSKNT